MIQNLQEGRNDLNDREARVISGTRRRGGRIPVEMFCVQEQLWVKPINLTLIPPCTESLTEEPFVRMPSRYCCMPPELPPGVVVGVGQIVVRALLGRDRVRASPAVISAAPSRRSRASTLSLSHSNKTQSVFG